jgi:phosphoribosylformylglycinamidine synthase
VDLGHEQALGRLMARASRAGHVSAAHDLSDGGLAQVLVESCLRRNIGALITLPEHEVLNTPFVYLFSESAGRALVTVPRGHDMAFLALAAEHNISCTPIGVTAEEPVLQIHNQFEIPLDELRTAFTSTMRELFGGPGELANRHGDPEHAAHPDDAESPVARSEPAAVVDVPDAPAAPSEDFADPAVTDSAAVPEPVEELSAAEPQDTSDPAVVVAEVGSAEVDQAEDESASGRSVTIELAEVEVSDAAPLAADDATTSDTDRPDGVGESASAEPVDVAAEPMSEPQSPAAGGPMDPDAPAADAIAPAMPSAKAETPAAEAEEEPDGGPAKA